MAYFIIAMSIIAVYGTFHFYFETASVAKSSFSIYFAYIYVSQTGDKSFLSMLVANAGAVDLTITSIEVDKGTVSLPIAGMNMTNILKAKGQLYIEVPLKNRYETGKSYDLSIITDPPAEYVKVKAIATLKTWE